MIFLQKIRNTNKEIKGFRNMKFAIKYVNKKRHLAYFNSLPAAMQAMNDMIMAEGRKKHIYEIVEVKDYDEK